MNLLKHLPRSIYTALNLDTAEAARKKRAKESALRKKVEKERKRDVKNEFGVEILKVSDTGEKRSSRHIEGADEDAENDYDPPPQTSSSSAAYNRENKVPVEHTAMAHPKKKRASPPKKGHVLSAQDIQDHFPDIDVGSSDEELHEENEEVSVICRRANMLRIVIILCR